MGAARQRKTHLSFFLHCCLWKAATKVSLSVIQGFVNRTKSFLAPRLIIQPQRGHGVSSQAVPLNFASRSSWEQSCMPARTDVVSFRKGFLLGSFWLPFQSFPASCALCSRDYCGGHWLRVLLLSFSSPAGWAEWTPKSLFHRKIRHFMFSWIKPESCNFLWTQILRNVILERAKWPHWSLLFGCYLQDFMPDLS